MRIGGLSGLIVYHVGRPGIGGMVSGSVALLGDDMDDDDVDFFFFFVVRVVFFGLLGVGLSGVVALSGLGMRALAGPTSDSKSASGDNGDATM